MSILWLNDILLEELEGGEKKLICDCPEFIYINIFSVVLAIGYVYFYKSNPELHNAPSNE
jgi:hypothetical protein